MLNYPYFNPAYLIETLEPDTVFFISERESVCLQDPLYYRLVQLIDGQRNVDEIIDILQLELLQNQELTQELPNFFQEVLNFSLQIQKALFQLHKQGYLLEKKEFLPSNLAILCHHLNISQAQAYEQLQFTKVAVKTLGSVGDEAIVKILKSFHIQVVEEGDLTIILTDDYLHPDLEEFNQEALASQTPWMLVKPLGTITWIGPLFTPNKTGCWHCFAQRLRDNRPLEEFINRQKKKKAFAQIEVDKIELNQAEVNQIELNKTEVNQTELNQTELLTPPLGFSEATIQTTLTKAATEVFKWIVQKSNPRIEGNLITYDTLTLQTQDHVLVKRPQCPSCGQIFNQQPLPVVLGHRKKAFTNDGGHRFCSPEETLRNYQHHISPITGIVRELANVLSFKTDGTTNYPPSADPLAVKWWQTATLMNQSYLVADKQMMLKKSSDYLSLASDDLLDDVKLCQQIIEKNGMKMLVLDQTRADIGLRVAKVIVPGMRHMWKRLGVGRLYDIPVKMKWLKESLKEDELNPFPMWM